MLLTGKAINFLRACCHDEEWVRSFAQVKTGLPSFVELFELAARFRWFESSDSVALRGLNSAPFWVSRTRRRRPRRSALPRRRFPTPPPPSPLLTTRRMTDPSLWASRTVRRKNAHWSKAFFGGRWLLSGFGKSLLGPLNVQKAFRGVELPPQKCAM
eukprot:COSAG04_NODE_878_length_9680_cov_2.690951_2_plen_157_part_00